MNDGAMRPKGGEPAEAEWVERLRSLPRRWFGEGREVRPTQQAARLMLILVAGGLLLMSLADLFAPPGSREIAGTAGGARGEEPALRVEGARPEGATGEVEALEARLAGDLESALAQVRGAGEVTIRVTLAGGFVSRYATEERANRNRTEERDASGGTREVEESEEATTPALASAGSGGEAPIAIERQRPEVRGVLVVAEGAADPRIAATLHRAVTTLLGVPAHRVSVVPGRP